MPIVGVPHDWPRGHCLRLLCMCVCWSLGRPRERRPHATMCGSFKLMRVTSPVTPQYFLVLVRCFSRPLMSQSNTFHSSWVRNIWVCSTCWKRRRRYMSVCLALYCAFLVWGHELSNAVAIFTDNNAVRDALISCCTSNAVARKLLIATLGLECEWQLTPWYSRVPADSNCADAPSRLTTKQLEAQEAVVTTLGVDFCRGEMLRLQDKWGEEQAPASIPSVKSWVLQQMGFSLHFVHNPACISFTVVSTMPCHGMSFAATDFKEDNQAVTCDSDLSNAERIGFEPGGLRSECCWQACMFKCNVNFTMFQTSTL